MIETEPKNLLPMAEASCACCVTDAAEAPVQADVGTTSNVTTVYEVAGMTCSHCASSVTAEVAKLPGVSNVLVDVASGRVTVTSQSRLDTESFVAAVDEAGYEVVSA